MALEVARRESVPSPGVRAATAVTFDDSGLGFVHGGDVEAALRSADASIAAVSAVAGGATEGVGSAVAAAAAAAASAAAANAAVVGKADQSALDALEALVAGSVPKVAVLASDYTNATAGFTTALSVTFSPTGSKAFVTLAFVGTVGTPAAVELEIELAGGSSLPLGSPFTPVAAAQWPFSGGVLFTGLTPGVSVTFNARTKPAASTFYCRPGTFPTVESMTLKAENVLS